MFILIGITPVVKNFIILWMPPYFFFLFTICLFGHGQMLAHFLFNQLGYFSLIWKSLSFNILFRVNQLAITLYIEDTPTAFDQFNI